MIMRRLFLWLGCADDAILDRCPRAERMRAAATGGTVLVVAVLAALSAIVTAHQFLHVGVPGALVLGAGWGMAIMALDRWLILSIRRQPTGWRTLLLALPRVAVAVVAGLVIAKPVMLVMFRGEIDARAVYDRRQALLGATQAIDAKYSPQITTLTAQRDTLESGLTTVDPGGVLQSDPIYQADMRRAQNLQAAAQKASSGALCELDGTCGSGHIGDGPIYATKEAEARSLAAQATKAQQVAAARASVLEAQQRTAASQAHRDERAQLAQVLQRLGVLRAQRAGDESAVRAKFVAPIGLSDRLDAMSEVMNQHPSTGRFELLLTLLILFLDSAPAVGKAILLLGPPTPYEHQQDQEERMLLRAGKLHAEAYLEAEATAAGETVTQAKMHAELWEKQLRELVPKVVAVQREVTEQAIADWADDAREETRRRSRAARAAASAEEARRSAAADHRSRQRRRAWR
jgi:hypothetical protein